MEEEIELELLSVVSSGSGPLTGHKEYTAEDFVTGKPKKAQGRPSIYTEELANNICSQLAKGKSLKKICEQEGMPNADTVYNWIVEDREGFSEKYARARDIQAEVLFDEILEIADNSDDIVSEGNEKKSSAYSNNQRLKVDARKWYLSKVLPKKFGEKIDHTTGGEPFTLNLISYADSKKEDDNTAV